MAQRANRTLWILFAAAWAIAIAYGLLSPGTYQDDDVDHYYLARQAWQAPELFLDRWGMPLLTATLAVPARLFGYPGAEATIALVTALAALLTALAARAAGMRRPEAVFLWFFLQPLTFELSFSALAEPLGALVLAAALLFWYGGRPGAAAIAAGLLPLARIEAGFLLVVLLFAGWRRIPLRAKALAVAPVAAWNAAGFAMTGDPLFVLALGGEKPLAGLGELQYVRNAIVAWGPVVAFFVVWGASARLDRAADGQRRFPAFALALVVSHVALLSVLGSESLPFGRSVGFLRHIQVLAPAVALVAGYGAEAWASGGPGRMSARIAGGAVWTALVALALSHVLRGHSFVVEGRFEARWIVTLILTAAGWWSLRRSATKRAFPGMLPAAAAVAAAFTLFTVRPIPLDSERLAVSRAHEYLVAYGLDRATVHANHPWFFFLSGRDRYDRELTPPLTREALDTARPGSLVLWENHYGPRLYGDVTRDELLADARFRRLLELTGGRDDAFRLVLLQRLADSAPR